MRRREGLPQRPAEAKEALFDNITMLRCIRQQVVSEEYRQQVGRQTGRQGY